MLFVILLFFPLSYCEGKVSGWQRQLDKADSLYKYHKDFDSALTIYNNTLKSIRAASGQQDTAVIIILFRLGSLYDANYNYSEAESCYLQALNTAIPLFGEKHPAVATLYYKLGFTNNRRGLVNKALTYYNKARDLTENLLPEEEAFYASILHNIALINKNIGKFRLSVQQFHRALEILTRYYGQESEETYRCLRNLATVLMMDGKYFEADTIFHHIYEHRKRTFGPRSPITGHTLLDMADVALRQELADKAQNYYETCLDILDDSLESNDLFIAQAKSFFGDFFIKVGKLDTAEVLIKEALQAREKKLGPDHLDVIDNVRQLGKLYLKMGKYEKAEPLLLRALENKRKYLGENNPYTANIMGLLGQLYTAWHKFDKAALYLKKALAIREDLFGTDSYMTIEMLRTMRNFYRASGDSVNAFRYATRAVNVSARLLHENMLTMSEKDALTYSQANRQDVDILISTYLDYSWIDDDVMSNLVNSILHNKGHISDVIYKRQQMLLANKSPDVTILLDSLKSVKYQLSRIFVAGPQANLVAYKTKIAALERTTEELEKELAIYGVTNDERLKEEFTYDSLLTALPEDGVFIEYYSYRYYQTDGFPIDNRYLAVVLKKGKYPIIEYLGTAGEIENLIDEYRQHMSRIAMFGGTPTQTDKKEYLLINDDLVTYLWNPVEKHLGKGITEVFISPDGALNYISFAGLLNKERKYLIERYAIHYYSSAGDFARHTTTSLSGKGLLALGDPDYNATIAERVDGRQPTYERKEYVQVDLGAIRSACGELQEIELTSLPGTRHEIELVAESWRKHQREPLEMFLGYRATEDNFKVTAPGKRVIHVATHGYFLEGTCLFEKGQEAPLTKKEHLEENPLLLTGLFLAGANVPLENTAVPIDDGILTACEVSALDLRGVELVVLSACKTGLGKVHTGEGIFGLRRAFQMAGAKTVMSTLWSISDQSTQTLFSRLYDNYQPTLPLSESWRALQLDMLKQLRQAHQVDHPYTWAGFVVFEN